MFGQNPPNTPFGGGGGFGQQQTNTTPGAFGAAPTQGAFGQFGAPAPTAFGSPAPTPFGSPAPAFGAPAPNSFGAPAPSAFGAPAPGGFGAPAASAFGAPAPSAFGAPAPSAFGAPAPSAFGAPAPSAFGAPAAPFGAPQPATGFGVAPTPFGAPAPTTFGAPAPSAFGAPAPTAFGAPAPSTLFGAPAPSTFGAPAPSAFGTFGAPAPSAFGSTAPSTPFASATPGAGLFGGAPSSGFGAPAPAPFGAAPSTGFGNPAPAPTLFGTPATTPAAPFGGTNTAFGSPAATTGGGTRTTPFVATTNKDGAASISFQTISAMPAYQNKQTEELRIEDYSQGNKGTPSTGNTMGGFGVAPATGFGTTPAPAVGLFGQPAPAPAFGSPAPAGGLFGSTPPPAGGSLFGSTAPAPSLFGQPAPAPFGAPAPATGMFGQPAPAFGAPAPSTSLFGQPAPAPFGAPSTTGFGAAPSGGLFNQPAPAFGTAPSTSLFGQPSPVPFGAAPTTSFGTAPAGGIFGQPAPAPAFGAPPSTFGQPAPAPFGAPVSGFGGTPTGGAFTQAAPIAGFGQTAPPVFQAPQPIFPQNSQIVPQANQEALKRDIQALQNQAKALEQTAVWGGSPRSPSTTPTSYPEMRSQLTGGAWTPSAPSSRARPRGFPKSESKQSINKGLLHRQSSPRVARQPEGDLRWSGNRLQITAATIKPVSQFMLRLEDQSEVPRIEETVDGPEDSTPVAVSRQLVVHSPDVQTPKSPGQLHYEQVIGITNDENTTSPEAVQALSSEVPTLTKAGYEVSPSLEALSKMDSAELATVTGFSVSRPGYGKVEWEGSVDVRNADLDSIVSIEFRDIAVYQQHEMRGEKPEEGRKLNRPASMTFYKVFPRAATDEAKEKMERKVRSQTSKMEAEFLSYDSATGVWKIRVRHFSRYCLDDDSSEEEAEDTANLHELQSPSAKSRDYYTDATPVSDTEGYDFNDDETYLQAQAASQRLYQSIQAERIAQDDLMVDIQDEIKEADFDLEDDDDSTCSSTRGYEVNGESKFLACKELSTEVIPHLLGRRSRACRVGFAPDGTFFSFSPTKFARSRPMFEETTRDRSCALLDTQLRCANQHDFEGCSLFALGTGTEDLVHALMDSSSGKHRHVFELIADLSPTHIHANEEVSMESREIAAATKLLFALGAGSDSTNSLNNMYACLAKGDTKGASLSACSADLANLAALFAAGSYGGDIGVDPDSVDPLSKNVLSYCESGSLGGNGLPPPHWYDILNSWISRNGDKSLADLLRQYEDYSVARTVPFPSPMNGTSSQTKCFYFKLLRFYSQEGQPDLQSLIDPKGYSQNVADFELAFHVSSAILASGKETAGNSDVFDRMSDAYQTQLCVKGLWERAVFVALCDLNSQGESRYPRKVQRAKSLILQFYNGQGEQQEQARRFLESFGVPPSWFSEAVTMYYSWMRNPDASLGAAMALDTDAGLASFEASLLPTVFFQREVLQELAQNPLLSGNDGECTLWRIVANFVNMQGDLKQLKTRGEAVPVLKLHHMRNKVAKLQRSLASLPLNPSDRDSMVPPATTALSTKMIAREMQKSLDHEVKQIEAFIHYYSQTTMSQ